MEFQDPIKRAALLAAKKGESKEPEPTQKASKDDDPMKDLEEELDREDFDVFSVDDIFDTGTGEPLFANFAFEDWALLSLRFEMHILIHAFKRDCGETDRTGIPPDHLTFYYYRYFKKGLNVQSYGCQNVADVLQLVRDTVLPCMKILEPQIDGELETNEVFLKLTEESRRERQKRIEVGEEGAVLKLTCTPYDIGLFNVGVGRPLPVRPSMMGVPGGMQMPGGMPGGMQMPGPPGMPVRAQMPGWNAGPPMRAQMPPGGAQNFGGPAWRPPNQNFGGPPNQNQMPRNNPGGCGGWPNAPCGGGGGGPGGGGGWPNAAPGGGGGWPNAGAPAQTKGGWENTNSAPAAKDGGWPAANGFPPAPGGWPAANGFPPAPAKAQAQGGWQDPAANFGAFGAPAQAKSGPSAWPAANNPGGWAAPANNAQGGWAAPGGNAQAPANNAQSGWTAPGGNAQAGNSGWQQSSGGQGGWNASSSNAQGGWTAPASNVQAGAAQGGWNASASTAQGGGWNAAGGNSQGGWNASGSGAEAGGWQSKDGGQQANVGGWQNPNSAPQAKAAWPATGNPAAVAGGWQQQQQQRTPPGGGGGDWN